MCAELFPEWISHDDWGYPIIRAEPVPAQMVEHARRAVMGCPKVALMLADDGA